MNLRQIEVFHAIYVSGSITAAARTLHVSQPSVSKTLKHAETRLGFELFRRSKGKLVPTEEAHLLFREVDDVYQRVGSLKLTMNNLRDGGGAGHLRIAVLPALGLGIAPKAIAKFRAGHAEVTFDVQTVDHVNMLRCLYERESDIAIGFSAPAHPRLRSQKIGTGELGLLQRKGTVQMKGQRFDLRKLQDQEYVSLTGSGPIGALLAGELARLEVQPREVAAARTFYVAAALVRQGVGVTVLDEFTARDMACEDMTFNPLTPAITFGVHCIWLEEKPPSALCRQFIDTVAHLLVEQ